MTKLWENNRIGFWLGTLQIVAHIFFFFVQLSKTLQRPATAFLVPLTLLAQELDTAADSKAQIHPGLPRAGGIWFQVYR